VTEFLNSCHNWIIRHCSYRFMED